MNLARIFPVVNGPLLSTLMLGIGVRCCNGEIYYGAIQDTLSLMCHNKNTNYIKIIHFELFMIQNAPKDLLLPSSLREFVFYNIFKRNKNHNKQNTAQGINYKLEKYNQRFKQFEVSSSPSIDKCTSFASAAPMFKELMENQSTDYSLDHGKYSEPGAHNYSARIDGCQKMLRETNV